MGPFLRIRRPPGACLRSIPASPAQILYTSGTTGRPKAAVLTHRGLTNNARLAAEAIGMRAGEAVADPMPLFHVAGCGLLTLGLVQTPAPTCSCRISIPAWRSS